MRPCPRAIAALAVAATTALVVALAGCGNDNADKARELTTAVADTTVEGRVEVTGSSTVEPISTIAAEAFRGQNQMVATAVEGPGTGDGFERFCEGAADITGASRPIKPEELEACRSAGVEVIELAIGLDGIAVITSPDSPVDCLTFAELRSLIGVEATGVERWSGASTTLPDLPLVLTGPGEESGTYDAMVSIVLDGEARPDYASTADDNAIIETVAGDDGSLGWVGLTFAERAPSVRLLALSEGDDGPCVAPTRESVQDGSYPISRDLFVYVSVEAAERDEVAAFVDFYLAGLGDFLRLTDYIPRPDIAATETTWADRTTLA